MKKGVRSIGIIVMTCVALIGASAFTSMNQAIQNPILRITQVDTSKFPEVTVYISSTDAAGNPVGLDPADLVVSENGVAMKPTRVSASGEFQSLTTMLVMDVSGSMGTNGKIEQAKLAAQEYIARMRPNDQVGLISYNTQVKVVQPITSDKTKLMDAVNSLEPGGDTSMYDALIQAEFALESMSGRKAIILLTDGLDNHSLRSASDVISAIGPSGLSISTIGLGNASQNRGNMTALDETTLRNLAENAGGSYSYVEDPQGLKLLFGQIEKALQGEFAITYQSPSALRDGVNRSLAVSLNTNASGGTPQNITARYNPGGLIPEVSNPFSWGLFAGLLALLLLLLALPKLVPAIIHIIKDRNAIKRSAIKKPFASPSPSKKIKLK